MAGVEFNGDWRSEIVERAHGRYLLKSGLLKNVVVARDFPKPKSRLKELIADSSGKTIEDAIENLIAHLDARQEQRKSARRNHADLEFSVPLAEEYVEALRHVSPSGKTLALLFDHAAAGSHGLSAEVLAKSGEHSDLQELLKSYEQLGRSVTNALNIGTVVSSRLAVIVKISEEGEVKRTSVLTLHPELREAVFEVCGGRRLSAP